MKRLLFLALLSACEPSGAPHIHASERSAPVVLVGTHTLRPTRAFRQVGLVIDGPAEGLRYRLEDAAGRLSEAQPVPLTWSEGEAHVGRILLATQATTLVLESAQPIEISAEFWEEPQTDPVRPLARELPLERIGTLRQALAPRELAIPREEWGARNPGLICADPANVYRISVHHTASPADDGGDPARRMRQIQAYHIDNNGWCDIGYHFVVSQSGQVYEARRDERAPAAHVGGQNTGNVGICFIGNYEEAEVPEAQFAAAARIMGWVRTTHGVPASRDAIRGHQEWPEQQTACPGRNLLRRLDELIARSEGGGVEPPPPPPPDEVEVDYQTVWSAPENPHTQGTSADVPDGRPGQRLQVVFRIHNQSPAPLRGVRLGYGFGEGLTPVDYLIQTDWPAKDQRTWVINDADQAPDNPPKDQLGADGELTMFAFGAGETKRVVVTLEVGAYRGLFRPEVRGFVRHIDAVYDQASFDAEPSLNTTPRRLAQAVGVDVQSPTEWAFPAPQADDFEGFSSCGGAMTNLDRALALPVGGCALSPPWTAADADRWDSLVVVLREAPEAGRLAVWWPAGDGALSRVLTFEVAGPGTWVLPMDAHPDWRGLVTSLRLTLKGAAIIDHLYPQSRARGESGSGFAPLAEGTATVLTDEDPPPAATDAGGVPEVPDAGLDDLPAADAGDDGPTAADASGSAGCQVAPSPTLPWVLLLVGIGFYRRKGRPA